jgi:histidine ammonia-lyase
MGASAARHARIVLGHVEQIVAIELLAAAQALDLRRDAMAKQAGGTSPEPGAGVAQAHAIIRTKVPRLGDDREPGPDMAALLALVHSGALAGLAAPAAPAALAAPAG